MSPRPRWRVLDTGPRNAPENMAIDRALLELRADGRSPNTLRFMQFESPAVLVGHHQTVAQEVRTEYCEAHGIEVNRRLTGGGAIYFDPSQVGWELVASVKDLPESVRRGGMAGLTARICEAAAAGLRRLGVAAQFRPRNDIEVDGRKISGTGGIIDGDAFLYQGTVLTDFDVEAMLLALRIPTEKLTAKGLETARDRVSCLRDLLDPMPSRAEVCATLTSAFADAFEVDFVPGELTTDEIEGIREVLPEVSGDAWVHAVAEPAGAKGSFRSVYKRPGGLLRTHALVDVKRSALRQVLYTGDFFVSPRRAMPDLEAWLKDTPFPRVRERLFAFFEQHEVDLVGLGPDDFWQATRLALEKVSHTELGLSVEQANRIYPVNVPDGQSVTDVLAGASVMLLPYCAKLPDCEFRFTDGCTECGLCTIGDAYRMARDKGLCAVTIVRFEHLQDTLRRMKAQGVTSYVGCCCEPFFVKRHQAFADAELPGVLLDIEGTTCYALGEEGKAYAGTFEAMADLDVGLLDSVMDLVPVTEPRFVSGPTPAREREP